MKRSSQAPENWRIDIAVSSSNISKLMEPFIYLELKLENSTVQTVEIPISMFHLLRQNVSVLMKEVSTMQESCDSIPKTVKL
ncbi:COMM domain-containing protein 5 [Bemisia tabaci]|uniref:COMM domain-containing protein 5 n=1 Tax=Bemisia tabaci TaxID=7038 RepID=UPI003B28AA4E